MSEITCRQWILQSARDYHEKKDSTALIRFAKMLHEHERALALLQAKGYGGAGVCLLDTVEEVPQRAVRDRD